MRLSVQNLTGCCFLLCSLNVALSAGNPAYEQRKADYISQALAHSSDAIILQAYSGEPLDSLALADILSRIPSNGVVDFDLVKLVRILYFTHGEYDSLILQAMNSIPYWLNKGDTLRGYWSENHMIQWMSSDWLLHERYGRTVDATLENRLRHFLRLKVQYGFYEFFSPVYAPYSLSGLLNLADFSSDVEIKNLATKAAQLLLMDLLMLTNDKGVFYPAAGRSNYGKYGSPYGHNHHHLIYLLTGLGDPPQGASHAGPFLATSPIGMDSVIYSWRPVMDTIYSIGHSLDSGFTINSSLSHADRIMFQWSSGAYFHPDVAQQTAELLRDSVLWNHIDFAPFRSFSSFSVPNIVALSQTLSNASKSSVICGQDVVIFKNRSVTLSSVRDFWKGKVGFQQFPCVANIGTTAVMTASGKVEQNWSSRPESNANEHLPYVEQQKNVALIMYRPEVSAAQGLLPFRNPEVALYFDDADFDEVIEDSLWLLGRQETNYVAARRSCIGEINGVRACEMNQGQTWVIVIGDSSMHGSFSDFKDVISQAQYTEQWYDSSDSQSVYYAKIEVDNQSIEHAWIAPNTVTSAGISLSSEIPDFKICPNPASSLLSLDLANFKNQEVVISLRNMFSQELYVKQIGSTQPTHALEVSDLKQGLYLLVIESRQGRVTQKFVKN